MSAPGRASLEDIISDALPSRLPPDVRERLIAKTIDAVRLWQEFRQERAREKEPSRGAGADLMRLAKKAILALEKARQQIGFSSTYQEAVDNFVWATDAQNQLRLIGMPSGNISEGWKNLAAADVALRNIEKTERPTPTHSAKGLDLELAHGLMRLQLWVDRHKGHRGISRGPATELAGSLLDVLKSEGVTEDEIHNMFANKLSTIAWLPRLSLAAAKKQEQRDMTKATLAFEQNWQSPRARRTKRTRRTN